MIVMMMLPDDSCWPVGGGRVDTDSETCGVHQF